MDASKDELSATTGKAPKTADAVEANDAPGVGDHIGEAAGGISGVLTGAAIGAAAGPVGTLIGGIAGAIGGWWAGRSVAEAAGHLTGDDDDYYRVHYEASPARYADRAYDDVRPAYHLGHIAGSNPEYAGREFDDIERDLQKGWSEEARTRHGEWDAVRGFAREGYQRRASDTARSGATRPIGADVSSERPSDRRP